MLLSKDCCMLSKDCCMLLSLFCCLSRLRALANFASGHATDQIWGMGASTQNVCTGHRRRLNSTPFMVCIYSLLQQMSMRLGRLMPRIRMPRSTFPRVLFRLPRVPFPFSFLPLTRCHVQHCETNFPSCPQGVFFGNEWRRCIIPCLA
jgi:hypothetical protein